MIADTFHYCPFSCHTVWVILLDITKMGIDIGKLQLVPISYCQEKNEGQGEAL